MRMPLRALMGAVLAKVVEPSKVGHEALVAEINGAYEEVAHQLPASWYKLAQQEFDAPLVETVDVVPFPAALGMLARVDRLDLDASGVAVRVFPTDDATPGGQEPAWVLEQRYEYEMLPGRRIRLAQAPVASRNPGIRFTGYPRLEPLAELDDLPVLPEQIHEAIVAKALPRVAMLDGGNFRNQKAVEAYIARLEDRLIGFLEPGHLDRAPRPHDEDPFYGGA